MATEHTLKSMDNKLTSNLPTDTVTSLATTGIYGTDGSSGWIPLKCDATGVLATSGGGGGGDATAANQQTMITSLSTIAGDTTSLDGKITQGEGNVTGGGSGLQQILCYGKDQSGNLDPLNVDANGHLKITLNDIEAGITSSIKVVEEKSATSANLETAGSSKSAGDVSTAITLGNLKNIQIVGTTTTSTAKIGISYKGASTIFYPSPQYADLLYDGTSAYTFAMTVQGIGASEVKVHYQTAVAGLTLDYHIF